MQEYPWYEVVEGDEQPLQGDFITSCPIVSSSVIIEGNAEISEYDVIIMSQSCDIVQKKLDLILVCPFCTLSDFGIKNDFFKSKKGKEALRRGDVHGYHLLNKCNIEAFERDYLVIDFRNVYSVSFEFLVEFVKQNGKRLRLLPPYREHLSQAFARFFMRVGLPVDIQL